VFPEAIEAGPKACQSLPVHVRARIPIIGGCVPKDARSTGQGCEIGFPINAHMLRHGGLTKLACEGHDAITLAAYAGHRQLQNLKRYIQLSPERFKGFKWGD